MRKPKTNPNPLRHLFSALAVFVLAASVPSYYVYTSVLEGSNEVYVTAIVPDNTEVASESSSSPSRGGSGSGAVWVQILKGEEEESAEQTSTGGSIPLVEGGDAESSTNSESADQIPSTDPEDDEQTQPAQTSVHFGGYSFPDAQVTFTLNGGQSFVVQADETGYFEGEYGAVSLGENVFSFVAENSTGNTTNLVSYNYTIQNESPVFIPYILLPPVIYVTSTGDLEGVAIPGSTVDVYGVSTEDQSLVVVDTVQVDADGNFAIGFDLGQELPYGQFYLSCELKETKCGYSKVIQVQTVGATSRFIDEIFADFTKDIKVNFIDFAFMREAFLKKNSNILYDLNQDGALDLKDFSLLNYQWTL